MQEHFERLFRYNEWANKQLFVALPEVVDKDPTILRLFSHLILAERLWLNRVKGDPEKFPVWEPIPFPDLLQQLNQSVQQWEDFLAQFDGSPNEVQVDYVNLQGAPFQNLLADILVHVVNHSTHHRGQIVALIRKQGVTPPILDYIAFIRNR